MPKKCIILDLETVPLPAAILDDPKFDFTLPIFHQIVCTAYAVLDDSFKMVDAGILGLERQSEKEALTRLSSMIDKDTMVVTWSGRRFDLPVILYRAMAHGVQCQWYFKNEFDKRYTTSGHFDLQDNMMLFGAADKIKLDHAAVVLGLPGKMDVQGADVAKLWVRHRYDEIGIYGFSDVVQTAVIFVRWAHLRGLASAEEVNGFLDSIPEHASVNTDQRVCQGIQKILANCDWSSIHLDK